MCKPILDKIHMITKNSYYLWNKRITAFSNYLGKYQKCQNAGYIWNDTCKTCITIVCWISHSWNANNPSTQRIYSKNSIQWSIFESLRMSSIHICCIGLVFAFNDTFYIRNRRVFNLLSDTCSLQRLTLFLYRMCTWTLILTRAQWYIE